MVLTCVVAVENHMTSRIPARAIWVRATVIIEWQDCEKLCLIVNKFQCWLGAPDRLAGLATVRYQIKRRVQREADRSLGRACCTAAVVDEAVDGKKSRNW